MGAPYSEDRIHQDFHRHAALGLGVRLGAGGVGLAVTAGAFEVARTGANYPTASEPFAVNEGW